MSAGRFVWYELITKDPKAAMSFYTGVVGWKTEPFSGAPADKPYTMWLGSQGPLGGVMLLDESLTKRGVPPHWMAHVEVADVDRTVAKVKELGGQVHHGPMDIPTIGRFAVIGDPQGAVLSVFAPEKPMAPHDVSKGGEFSWNELYTTDAEAALKFYGAIFGWKKESEFDMGPMGKYLLFGQGGTQYGGMMTKPAGAPMPTAWGYYVRVDDFDSALERAKAKGAKVVNGPMQVPTGDRIVQMTDPQGVFIALNGK
jgi:predicted enzyme related to lactoylglutathione lyase